MSFAEGRAEDTPTFLSTCGKDAVGGAQADGNLACALPRTPVGQEENEKEEHQHNSEVNCCHFNISAPTTILYIFIHMQYIADTDILS